MDKHIILWRNTAAKNSKGLLNLILEIGLQLKPVIFQRQAVRYTGMIFARVGKNCYVFIAESDRTLGKKTKLKYAINKQRLADKKSNVNTKLSVEEKSRFQFLHASYPQLG